MSGKKECWNICCVCWEINPERGNCNADDLNPSLCRKSDIDLRSMLEEAKKLHAMENNTLPIYKIIHLLKNLKTDLEEKWPRSRKLPGKETINYIISALEKR